MNTKFHAQLVQVNQGLKAAHLRVSIQWRKNSLYIRAILPPKPGSDLTKAYQQSVPTGLKAELASLRLAEKMAKEIAAKLASRTFDWIEYGVAPVKSDAERTVREWIEALELAYFRNRQRNATTEQSWKMDWWQCLKRLPQDQLLTVELLHEAIVATEPNSRTRRWMYLSCRALGTFAGLNVESVKTLKGSYSSQKPTRRTLPSDEEIVQAIDQIPYLPWRWVAGMIATYGLRPHEVFHLDLSSWPWVEVGDETKTGWRRVPPLHPEWIEAFDLGTPQIPKISGSTNRDRGRRVSEAFLRYELPFPPYDLRRAWAVRAIDYNAPVTMAAKWMGHSVKVHTRVYQAWISEPVEQAIYERSIERLNNRGDLLRST